MPTADDFQAAIELSDELPFTAAVKFIRSETGFGLSYAASLVEARRNSRKKGEEYAPDSK